MATTLRPRVRRVDRIFFVQWETVADRDDMRFVAQAMVEARRTVGHPLIVIAVFPANAKLPDQEALREAIRLLPLFDKLCESQFAVLEGNSISNAILRGGLATVMTLMRIPASIVATLDAAVQQACTRLRIDPCVVLAGLRSSDESEAVAT